MTDTPLQFPCDFPIKAMGEAGDDFRDLVVDIVRRHAADLDESLLRVQASRSGRYQSVTVVVRATSRQQLDAIYRDLTAHVRVVMVL